MSLPAPDRKKIVEIAKTSLGLETLDKRNSDSLDFHDLSVWRIEAALEAAFRAGQESVKPKK